MRRCCVWPAMANCTNRNCLSRQIDRMLADPQCEGFVQGFARQWLKVDEISRFAPDLQIYPTITRPTWPASSRM